ncbi:MAG: hybrid sensor histidine kinase/response regulator [Bacteroidetes bacterium]|nr:hybrid sensor histidine kinase/response regulator [Bacteroidota bacterium]MBU1114403.1 hybrid sensor histidine kinase/response regulator [Bacteroidota bacterium]MBU1797204.1 hybrid sensor histidine kinase/response regulator [Bacteroidota bacterium]
MDTIVNILLVDDNPAKLESIATMIESNSLNVVKVEDGYSAIQKANELKFALILLDVSMPILDGYETAAIIRESSNNSTTPIIFITATYFEEEHKFKGYASGAVDFLTTPFVPSILKSKVNVFVELYKKTKKLEKSLIKNEKFYSIIAHDLRSSFNPLLGLSQMLMEDADIMKPNEIKEMSSNINIIAKNLFSLLTDLLELSSLKSEDFVYIPTKLNLKNTIEHVLELNKYNAESKNITLEDRTQDNYLFADRIMLQTIINNLVSNAVKFTPTGGSITIGSNEVGTNIDIMVTDTGLGIKPENLDKLFRSDIKFTTNGTNKEIGTGLGLSICAELVKRQNGFISVKSELGSGTTFTVTLPKYVQ